MLRWGESLTKDGQDLHGLLTVCQAWLCCFQPHWVGFSERKSPGQDKGALSRSLLPDRLVLIGRLHVSLLQALRAHSPDFLIFNLLWTCMLESGQGRCWLWRM